MGEPWLTQNRVLLRVAGDDAVVSVTDAADRRGVPTFRTEEEAAAFATWSRLRWPLGVTGPLCVPCRLSATDMAAVLMDVSRREGYPVFFEVIHDGTNWLNRSVEWTPEFWGAGYGQHRLDLTPQRPGTDAGPTSPRPQA